jgi:hypothetical protein
MSPAEASGVARTEPRRKSGRASEEAVMKRRAARHFNDVLLGGSPKAGLDGRTAKRRLRLLEELKNGTVRSGKRELKPIDVLLRVQALLDLNEPIASLKKACKAARPVTPSPLVIEGVRSLHAAYGFSPSAYQFVGIDDATLRKAGLRVGAVRKTSEREVASGRVRAA